MHGGCVFSVPTAPGKLPVRGVGGGKSARSIHKPSPTEGSGCSIHESLPERGFTPVWTLRLEARMSRAA